MRNRQGLGGIALLLVGAQLASAQLSGFPAARPLGPVTNNHPLIRPQTQPQRGLGQNNGRVLANSRQGGTLYLLDPALYVLPGYGYGYDYPDPLFGFYPTRNTDFYSWTYAAPDTNFPLENPNFAPYSYTYKGGGLTVSAAPRSPVKMLPGGAVLADLGDSKSAVVQPCVAARSVQHGPAAPGTLPLFAPVRPPLDSMGQPTPYTQSKPSGSAQPAAAPASGGSCWATDESGRAVIVWT